MLGTILPPLAFAIVCCALVGQGSDVTERKRNQQWRKQWSFAAGGPVTAPSVSPHGDKVYIGSSATLRTTGGLYPETISEDMELHALSTANGRKLWSFNATQELTTQPCCNGHMYGMSRPILSPDGAALYFRAGLGFFGVHATNGSLKFWWNMFDRMVGDPTVSPDSRTLYVASVSYEDKVICALDIALNLSNYFDWNQCRWLRRTWASSSPVVSHDGKSIYYGNEAGNATALGSSDGSWKWGFPVYMEDVGEMVPSPDGETVFFQYATSDKYFALNAADGSQKWNYSYLPTDSTPALSPTGDTVYTGIAGLGVKVRAADGKFHYANSSLVALDSETGREKWNFNTSTSASTFGGKPIATKDAIYFTSSGENVLRAVNAADGSERFSFNMSLPSGLSSTPALSPDGGIVFCFIP